MIAFKLVIAVAAAVATTPRIIYLPPRPDDHRQVMDFEEDPPALPKHFDTDHRFRAAAYFAGKA